MNSEKIRVVGMGIVLLVLVSLFPLKAAAVPELINYQGYLTDAGGNPLNGNVTLTFRIWDADVAGSELWSESHAAVPVARGVFNVVLGASVAISSSLLDGNRYLGVTAGTDSEMVPRVRVTSAPYAIRAGYAENVAAGAVTTSALSDTAVTEAKIAGGSVSSEKLASASVTAEKVASGAVSSDKLVSGAVTETKIASLAVSSDKLANASVTGAKVASGTLTATHLQDGAALAEILDDDGPGSGLNADFLDNLDSSAFALSAHNHDVTYVKLGQTDSISTGMVQNASVTGAKVASGTLTATHLQDGAALAEILDDDGPGSSLNADFLDNLDSSAFALSTHNHDATYVNEGQANSVTTAMVQNGAVTKGKLSAAGGTSGQVLGTDGTSLVWQNSSAGWGLTGNAGTDPDTNFIGTTDNEGLTFKVNNVKVFQIRPTVDSPNIIMGYHENSVIGAKGASIGGGGWIGKPNVVGGNFGTVSGGEWNTVTGTHSTVGGGYLNGAIGSFAIAPGGRENLAQGDFSFAAGRKARAQNLGCFVWGDSTDAFIDCINDNRWMARASGGVYFYTNSTLTSGAYVSAGGSGWNTISDRNLKENFASVDGKTILARLSEVPISTWNYKSQDSSIRHMGPVSQDFVAAFGLGESEKHINTIDLDGVALAAIQGLFQIVKEKEAEIERIAKENRELREAIQEINRRLEGVILPVASLVTK